MGGGGVWGRMVSSRPRSEIRRGCALALGAEVLVARVFLQAISLTQKYKSKLKDGRNTLQLLKPGLALFDMDLPDDTPLKQLETDLELLSKVWTVSKNWSAAWDGWKYGKFDDIDVKAMENMVCLPSPARTHAMAAHTPRNAAVSPPLASCRVLLCLRPRLGRTRSSS